jgi:hypothetical protein
MREPYKDGFFWRDNTPGWGFRMYNGYPDGKGDLGFNTCDQIIRDNDKSLWAYEALYECADLLLDGKRWPDRMNQDIDSKNRLDSMRYRWPGKVKRWLIKRGCKNVVDRGWKYRWQTGMTRDPFTAFYTACMLLGEADLLRDVMPIWYNYRPSFWAWYKFLKTGKAKHLKRYRFWSKFTSSKKDYVSRLSELREIAISLTYKI